jgi:cbb3-type cytochrome oxidase subunit 1
VIESTPGDTVSRQCRTSLHDSGMSKSPKRPWFRFSLRTLFVVVTVAGIWFALSAWARMSQPELPTWAALLVASGVVFWPVIAFRHNRHRPEVYIALGCWLFCVVLYVAIFILKFKLVESSPGGDLGPI